MVFTNYATKTEKLKIKKYKKLMIDFIYKNQNIPRFDKNGNILHKQFGRDFEAMIALETLEEQGIVCHKNHRQETLGVHKNLIAENCDCYIPTLQYLFKEFLYKKGIISE